MAAWFDGIEVYVELSWGSGPRTAIASMTWTDYADDVVSIDVSRGSQSEFGDFPPGTATIVINDPGRVFDASNTAGPNYGEVVPMVPVRIRAVAGATSAALFFGYVASFALSWPVDGRAPVCVLTCVDGTRVLEAARLAESAFEAEILADDPAYYWPLQSGDLTAAVGGADFGLTATGHAGVGVAQASTFPVGQSSPSGRADTEITASAAGVDIPTLATLPSSVEFVAAADPATGVIDDAYARLGIDTSNLFGVGVASDEFPGITVTFADSGANLRVATGGSEYVPMVLPAGDLHVVAVNDGSEIVVYVNGAVATTLALEAGTYTASTNSNYPGGVLRMFGETPVGMSHVAFYNSALTAAQVAAHYDAGLHAFGHPYGDGGGTRTGRILDAISHPSADRDIDAGSTVLDAWLPAGGDALSAIRETIAPEQALVYFAADGKAVWRSRNWQRTAAEAVTAQATFGDQTGEIRYTDDLRVRRSVDDIYNHTTVSYNDGSVSVEDATSIAAYGEQRESISATLIDDMHTARQLAAMRVREHKDAADRIEALTVLPRRDTETVVAALLGLDLGYRVTVNRRPIGGTGSMALEMSVRGITHHIDRSAVGWVSTLYLAPPMTSYVDGPWLTLGDADCGKIGAVAGNLIPY